MLEAVCQQFMYLLQVLFQNCSQFCGKKRDFMYRICDPVSFVSYIYHYFKLQCVRWALG